MLGIALVADDVRKGPKVVFSYPLSTVELTGRLKENSSTGVPSHASNPTTKSTRDGKTPGDNSSQTESVAADYFARLFRPKPTLCNAPFLLTVENTVFISYPIILPISQASKAATTVPTLASTTGAPAMEDHLQAHNRLVSVGGFAAGPGSAPTPLASTSADRQTSTSTFKLGDDTDFDFLPAPQALTTPELSNTLGSSEPSGPPSTFTNPTTARNALSLFNIVFVIDPNSHSKRMRHHQARNATSAKQKVAEHASTTESAAAATASVFLTSQSAHSPHPTQPISFADANFSDYLQEILSELDGEEARQLLLDNFIDSCQRIATALWYEERRCGYVTKQVTAMLDASTIIHEKLAAPTAAPPQVRRAVSASIDDKAPTKPGADEKEALSTSAVTVSPKDVTLPTPASTPAAAVVTKALTDAFMKTDASRSPLGSALMNDSATPADIKAFEVFPLLSLSLGWELAYVFHTLCNGLGSVCRLKINGWLSLSLSLSAFSPNKANSYVLRDQFGKLEEKEEMLELRQAYAALLNGDKPLSLGSIPSLTVTTATPRHTRLTMWHTAHDRRPAAKMMPIRPYHTLLLLRDTENILRLLPADAPPQIVQLICAATPLRSFNELQGETGIPSSQLLRLAAHLVHWGLAIITNVITNLNVYTVSPTVDLSPASATAAEFKQLFGSPRPGHGFSLAHVLSLFSKVTYTDIHTTAAVATGNQAAAVTTATSRASAALRVPSTPYMGGSAAFMSGPPPLERIMQSSQKDSSTLESSGGSFVATTGTGIPLRTLMEAMPQARAAKFIDVLTWLLKHGYLRQMHTYIYLLWPFPLKLQDDKDGRKSPRTLSGTGLGSPTGGPTSTVPWSTEELEYLQDYCRAKPPALVPLFKRLLSYVRDTMANFGSSFESVADDFGATPGIMRSGATDLFDFDGMSPILKLGLRLEEIMWRLHVSRSDLLQVLSAFSDVLVTSMHD